MSTPIDDARRGEVVDLIRALSMVAGDEQKVIDLLARYARLVGIDRARADCAAALAVTFGACMSQPVPLTLPGPHRTTIEGASA